VKANPVLSGEHSGQRDSGRSTSPDEAGSSEGGGEINPSLWEALARAGQQVHDGWCSLSEDAVSAQEVEGLVERLVAGIRCVACSEADRPKLPLTILARRVLVLLRRKALIEIEQLADPPPAAEIVTFLQAFEFIAEQLEPDWSGHLANRLSGPDGLEMVVEVAHDLRSPITSILFLAEILQQERSGPITELQERQLGLIYSAAFGLSAMASDVLELARGGDRLVDLDPIPFSIADIMESVRDIVEPIAEEKGLTVLLSEPPSDFRVGYPVALSRVLLNLTTNALKFTDEGEVQILATQSGPDSVEFTVQDSGRGIAPAAMRTLFEPFRRRQNEGEYTFSGSGLGLSICRKLVEAMGSEMQVDTVPDKGTRFYFDLPLPLSGHGS
jgi:signal transduction histidine kinase